MMALVLGGSASGKSAFAERLAQRLWRQRPEGEKVYLATMRPEDAESRERIRRHQENRAGAGFVTREVYGLLDETGAAGSDDTVLLECLSNYLSNVLFGEAPERWMTRAGQTPEQTAEVLAKPLLALRDRCTNLIVVSNLLQADGRRYDAATERYLDLFGRLNRALACRADQVYEVVCGAPLALKPEREESR